MSDRSLQERRAVAYYEARFAEHGCTAAGVDWGSRESQETRFDQLLRVVDRARSGVSLNDFGCGYGALVSRLETLATPVEYTGFDLSSAMIEAARRRHGRRRGVRFVDRLEQLEVADYTVASGLFNVCQEAPEDEWLAYVHQVLDDMARRSRVGFAFNVLTSFSDPERKVPGLFYADPSDLLRHCQRRYSRWARLDHDYGLFELTLYVRCEEEGDWLT